MHGLMMDRPLLISSVIEYAARQFGDREIVSRRVEGDIHRYGYRQACARSKQVAGALTRLGIEEGDRVATLAWTGYRHFELYYGISGMGAVCHTLNPRLHPDQLTYIANHSEAKLVFFDLTFLPLVEAVQNGLPGVMHFIALCDREHMPETELRDLLCYEDLLAAETDHFDWPELDENVAAVICYTSGTTGHPKGVVYSHRTQILHSWATGSPNVMGIASRDSVLVVVPMFHISGWGLVYTAPMAGAKLVLPGPALDGKSVADLINAEGVTLSAGVPTVWHGLYEHLEKTGQRVDSLKRLLSGGSAVPVSMIVNYRDQYDVQVVQGWGMTETTVATVTGLKPGMETLPEDRQLAFLAMQGYPLFGMELRIVDEAGNVLPEDGETVGEVQIRGAWTTKGYFKGEGHGLTEDGWFATGDVAAITPEGHMCITDRIKDVIKSGGEWISSIDVENLAMSHPDVAQAAVIGLPHPKWQERPLLIVISRDGAQPAKDDIVAFMDGQIAKWWMPDDVVFVDEFPLGPTGKVLKRELRERFRNHVLPTAKT